MDYGFELLFVLMAPKVGLNGNSTMRSRKNILNKSIQPILKLQPIFAQRSCIRNRPLPFY